MTTENREDAPPAAPSETDADGARIIPFPRPSAPGGAPAPASAPDDRHPDDDGPSAA